MPEPTLRHAEFFQRLLDRVCAPLKLRARYEGALSGRGGRGLDRALRPGHWTVSPIPFDGNALAVRGPSLLLRLERSRSRSSIRLGIAGSALYATPTGVGAREWKRSFTRAGIDATAFERSLRG